VVEAFLAVSFVRTLVLIAIAAGLGAWLYLVELPNAENEAKATFLVDLDPASVDKLRLSYPDGSGIDLVREGAKWKMTVPLAYPADSSVVENFLTTIQETKIERRLTRADAGAAATYGLEGDSGTTGRIEITLAGGKPLPAIVLGIATPVGYQAFARRDGDEDVLVIPLLLQSSARKSPFDLRFKSMFEGVDSTGVKRVTIENPDRKIELEKRGEAAWAMTSPISDAADTEAVNSMLDSIATIDALAFFDGTEVDRKKFGLEDGATRFSAQREDGTTVAFTIGAEATDAPAGNYFERTSDHQVAKIPDWAGKKFAPAVEELRDKRLLSCRIDEIRSLTWSMGADRFTISREAAGKPWSISPENPDQVLNQRIVDNVLQGLALARADEVVGDAPGDADLKTYGLDAPLARLEIAAEKGPCAALSAALAPTPEPSPDQPPGRAVPKSYFVKNDGRSAVLRASEHEYSRIAMKRPAFVDAAPKAAAQP